ncbi:MAG: NAD-dependent epimerase/dehydratase family protein [Flavobacteriales bacterium]|nr:NAD-dependent epimerase/dehydratase family protein [Flavobacteriales bacterium]
MIFVTGGTGIVGIRILYDLLKKGRDVRALKRSTSDLEIPRKVFQFYNENEGDTLFKKITWVEGDLRDIVSLKDGMRGCSELYHAGALVSFKKEDRELLMETNVEGTANIVNAALDEGVERFCYISSVATLGRSASDGPTTEESERSEEEQSNNYGSSKYFAEMEVWRGIEEGLNAVILCPSLIIGAGRPYESTGQFFYQVKKGMKYYGPGKNAIVDVRTISEAALLLMQKEVWKERFILSAENLTYKEIFTKIATAMNEKAPQKEANKWMMNLIGNVSEVLSAIGIKTFVSKENMKSAQAEFEYDNSKLSRYIDIEYPTAARSIQYFAEFYKQILY